VAFRSCSYSSCVRLDNLTSRTANSHNSIGGYVPAPPDFLQKVREFAHSKNALLICDEVQTGFGRTGSLFASSSSHYEDVNPDILTMAKGIASGFPLSAVAMRREISDACEPGMLGGTYAGNALSCAAAVATQHVLREEGLVENSERMGVKLRENLMNIQNAEYTRGLIGDVRGLGLMVGMEFTPDVENGIKNKFCQEAVKEGLLVLGCSTYEVVRFVPPLNVSEEEIDQACEKVEAVLKRIL
jgi:4-aminobutyrate aminotransferase